MDHFDAIHYGEGRTGVNQLVEFSCPTDVKIEDVKSFLKQNIEKIDIPTTSRINVPHGGYGRYSRYQITQHDYAGGGCGYIEVLEIKHPPDDRCGIVIHEYRGPEGSFFSEWKTLKSARAAFKKYWGCCDIEKEFSKLRGFKRWVICRALSPWFYAIGEEVLIGDYAFPNGLQDDPVYRFGRQFVVFDKEGIPAIKTCMGTRFVTHKNEDYPHKEYSYRLVYWDDGSVWDEANQSSWWSNKEYGVPRPAEEKELWIAEAVQEFRKLLAGKSTDFVINFIDGSKFTAKLKQADNRNSSAEGRYDLAVYLKGQKKPQEGWLDFKPTEKTPNILEFVTQGFKNKGLEVERIEVKKCDAVKGGKKWKGVFFNHFE